MPIARSGSLDIYYEDDAELPDDPPLVLINGLGSQLIFFEDEFVQGLIDRAFRVIRLDNRDAGLSSSVDHATGSGEVLDAWASGDTLEAPYTLSDMAGDVVALLDHLELDSAHILGVSLGGMIAQTLAVEHPDRVRTLTLLSSTTGSPDVGQPTQEAIDALFAPPPGGDLDAQIQADVEARRIWSTTAHWDEAWTSDYFRRCYERGNNPDGTARQMAAVAASGDREATLPGLDVPTVVLHGTDDKLVNASGGARLAELIPGASFVELDDMGHDLPPHYWAPVIEAVTQLAIRSL